MADKDPSKDGKSLPSAANDAAPKSAGDALTRAGLGFFRIIDRRFQLTSIGVAMVFGIDFLALLTWFAFGLIRDFDLAVGSDPGIFRELIMHRFWFTCGVWAFLQVILVILTLVITNRVAGPLKRLENALHRAESGDGEFRGIKFRDHDYFMSLADAISKLAVRTKDDSPPQAKSKTGETAD